MSAVYRLWVGEEGKKRSERQFNRMTNIVVSDQITLLGADQCVIKRNKLYQQCLHIPYCPKT